MNPGQTGLVTPQVGELCSRLDGLSSLLSSVATAGGVEDNARAYLEYAIESIQAVSEDLAAVCEERPSGISDSAFVESRASEAKSEVDSGEFDAHG